MASLFVDLLALDHDAPLVRGFVDQWLDAGHGLTWLWDANRRPQPDWRALPRREHDSQVSHLTVVGRGYLVSALRFALEEIARYRAIIAMSGGPAEVAPRLRFIPSGPGWPVLRGGAPERRPCVVLTSPATVPPGVTELLGAIVERIPVLPATAAGHERTG